MAKKSINRALLLFIVCIMIFSLLGLLGTETALATSTRIGHATNDERGKLTGGKAGDQTGSEVATAGYRYGGGAFHWTFVARPKDVVVAAKMANQMKAACANNHIGYDKSNRISVYKAAKASGWDMSKISSYVECDCISLVATVATASGAPVSPYAGSSTLKSYIRESGCFEILTSGEYTATAEKLLPGDILCAEGKHACMVIESPNKLCFDLKYKNTKGIKKVAKIEVGGKVKLNYNNGQGTESIIVDKPTDLKKFEQDKKGYTLVGWQKVGDDAFSATYKGKAASINAIGGVKVLD